MRTTNIAKQLKMNLAAAACCTVLAAVAPAPAVAIDLTVQGTIAPNACTPTFAAGATGGLISIPQINKHELKEDEPTQINSKTIEVNINCPTGSTQTALSFYDVSPNPLALDRFSIGLDDKNKQIGYIQLKTSSGGNAVSYIIDEETKVRTTGRIATAPKGTDGATEWTNIGGSAFTQDNLYAIGSDDTIGSTTVPKSTSDSRYRFDVVTSINAAQDLNLKDEVEFEGSIAINVEYI